MTHKKGSKKESIGQKIAKDQTTSAKRILLEEVFQDMSNRRWQIYRINLVRGLFFGFGSVLGGTILITLLVWTLSALGGLVPFLSDFIREILDALNSRG